MTGKVRELVNMMERSKVQIMCVQETKWKCSMARTLEAGFQLFYQDVDKEVKKSVRWGVKFEARI